MSDRRQDRGPAEPNAGAEEACRRSGVAQKGAEPMRNQRRLLIVTIAGSAVMAMAGPAAADTRPTTSRVSVSSTGAQATDDNSIGPAISANGRYVAFYS